MSAPVVMERFNLLRTLFTIAVEQARVLEGGDFERFQALLEERDVLIQRLQDIGAPFSGAALPGNVIPFPRAADGDAISLDDELAIETLVRGILEHDRNNERVLETRLSEIREELRSLGNAGRAIAGYGTDAGAAGFIDRVI